MADSAVRRFIASYGDLPSAARLELGYYNDRSLRLNVLGASKLPLALHQPHLPRRLFAILEKAMSCGVSFHIGLCAHPAANAIPEVYLLTIKRPLPGWLRSLAGSEAEELAIVGVSDSGVKQYVVETPSPSAFDIDPAACVDRRMTQYSQLVGGHQRKQYLDIRPFPDELVEPLRRRAHWPIRPQDLRYGVVARSSSAWGFYAPLTAPHEVFAPEAGDAE